MTRTELLQRLITQARESGFEFRKWFRQDTARPWTGASEAVDWLAQGSRAHMLLFSHSFARAFFRQGERLRFIQPALAYQRVGPNGSVQSVQRRAHTRQSNREDVWRYHLREMALAEDPLRYLLLTETMGEAQSPETVHANTSRSGTALGNGTQPSAQKHRAPAVGEKTNSTEPRSTQTAAALRSMRAELPDPLDYDDELLVRD